MIISITGATGFIGSHLVDLLLARGHEIRVLVRKTSNQRWLEGKQVHRIQGDIRDAASLESFVQGVDYVYHIAGVVKSRDRVGYFEGNVEATRNLLEAVKKFAPNIKRFLYVSSQTAAGPSTSLEAPLTESDPCRPITTYGESKAAAEAVVRSYEDLPWTIVRPPAVFGPRDTEIFIYFKAIASGLNSMIGLDEKHLSLIHSADLIRGFVLAAESPVSAGETYFLSSQEFYTWPQVGKVASSIIGKRTFTIRIPHAAVYGIAVFSQAIARLRGKAATLNIEKARDITQRYWICDTSKAVRELGYKQELSLEAAIQDTVEWYKQQGWLK